MDRRRAGALSFYFRIFALSALVAGTAILALVILGDKFQSTTIEISGIVDAPITVAIDGEVKIPGAYSIPSRARLNDLVIAAGGFTDEADMSGLNLAARIGDGESIRIPSLLTASPIAADSSTSGLININTATAAELNELPGIGDVLAARIIEYRDRFGPFSSVDQLIEVDGISLNTIEELRPLVTVNG